MELLKEISKTKLIIMVTHNQELAEKYSNRIVHFILMEKYYLTAKSFNTDEENLNNNKTIKRLLCLG